MINTITILGNVTRDAELVGKEGNIAHFTLAVNDRWGQEEKTYFFPCTMFKAERIASHITKGTKLAVTGAMTYSEKDDKKYWEVVVRDLAFCTPAGSANSKQKGDEKDDMFSDDDIPF